MTTTETPTKRAKRTERGQQAIARHRELGKRGPGRKMTDDEMVAYIAKVKAEHPDAVWDDEVEYAYWCEGIACGRGRFERLWNGEAPKSHEHSATTCAHGAEGPTIIWLCGYEPTSTPVGTVTPIKAARAKKQVAAKKAAPKKAPAKRVRKAKSIPVTDPVIAAAFLDGE